MAWDAVRERPKEEKGTNVERFGRYTVELSNLQKVLFPEDGYTKRTLIDYYERISERMLPLIKDRPITMVRYPDGIRGESFFQKDAPDYFPEWFERVKVKKKEGTVDHLICGKTADLVYLANQACITPHIFLSRKDKLDIPDRMIFDLDPSGDDFSEVRNAALTMREMLGRHDLRPFIMTTGSRGVHVVVPLRRQEDFDTVRSYAQKIAGEAIEEEPEAFTTQSSKEKRRGRLLIDVMRNSYAQTSVAPYAVRAKDGAPVATPIHWDEVEDGKVRSQSFNISNIFQRLKDTDDPWKNMGRYEHSLKLGKS
jgi:bifunctional non-homologous end joining protein LigD